LYKPGIVEIFWEDFVKVQARSKRAALRIRVALFASLAFTGSLCFGQRITENERDISHSKMSMSLERLANKAAATPGAAQNVRVIVQFNHALSQQHLDKVQGKGGKLGQRLGLINGGAFSLPVSRLRELANDDDVAFISVDHKLKAADDLPTRRSA
jgi:hypothetical protein